MTISRSPTLGEKVYSHIRDRIISGEYRPGQILIESELAQELSVSRTPVSNALIMLKERGLLEDKGARLAVPQRSLKDVIDLYTCRLAFDGLATRLAAEKITKKEVKQLERHLKVWQDPAKEDDPRALWVADLSFHESIYQISDNRHLLNFAQAAADLAAVYRRSTFRRMSEGEGGRSQEDVRAEHNRIFEALTARDPDAAERAAREHIENVIRHLQTMEVIEADVDVP